MSCVPVCNCNTTMSNTGINGCNPLMQVTKKIILVPTYDSTGARNSITLATSLNQAYFTAKVNQADASKRWFPLPSMVDVNDQRNDAVMQTVSDDTEIYIKDGIRKFIGMVWGTNASPMLKAKVESARCIPVSAYLIDRLGNLIGGSMDDAQTVLYPFQLDQDSVHATLMQSTDKTTQGVKIGFNFSQDELDSCIRMIKQTEMGGANLLTLAGLKEVYMTVTSSGTAGAVVSLYFESVNPKTPVPATGLVTADFISSVTSTTSKVRRTNNTAADVTVAVTESTTVPGTYTLAYTATAGDIIVVDFTKSGLSATNVIASPMTTV